jgi:hypothetical protein
VYNLSLTPGRRDIEAYRALNAVEIVVQPRGAVDEQRSRDAAKVQPAAEIILKKTLQCADRFLRIINAKYRGIALRNIRIQIPSLLG